MCCVSRAKLRCEGEPPSFRGVRDFLQGMEKDSPLQLQPATMLPEALYGVLADRTCEQRLRQLPEETGTVVVLGDDP